MIRNGNPINICWKQIVNTFVESEFTCSTGVCWSASRAEEEGRPCSRPHPRSFYQTRGFRRIRSDNGTRAEVCREGQGQGRAVLSHIWRGCRQGGETAHGEAGLVPESVLPLHESEEDQRPANPDSADQQWERGESCTQLVHQFYSHLHRYSSVFIAVVTIFGSLLLLAGVNNLLQEIQIEIAAVFLSVVYFLFSRNQSSYNFVDSRSLVGVVFAIVYTGCI